MSQYRLRYTVQAVGVATPTLSSWKAASILVAGVVDGAMARRMTDQEPLMGMGGELSGPSHEHDEHEPMSTWEPVPRGEYGSLAAC